MIPDRDAARGPVIALVGEALEDVFPGETPVPGGAPLNVACHLRALGAEPLLVTRLGLDVGGDRLMQFLHAHGLSDAGVQRDRGHGTGRVDVRSDGTRNAFDIPMPQAFDFLESAPALDALAAAGPARAVYYGTLAQRHETSRAAIRRVVDAVPGVRFCDLNLRPPFTRAEVVRESLARAGVLKVNTEELAALVAQLEIPESGDPARALFDTYPATALVVTDGERGARRLDRARGGVREARAAARPPARLVDTVGAGDGFSAVTILGLVLGWPPGETLRRASAFAGALCGIRGAVPADDAFYAPFRGEWGLAA